MKEMPDRGTVIGTHSSGVPSIVHEALRSPGQPLDEGTRAYMEPRFGHDFSKVRIHADNKAAESAKYMNARAYTIGSRIVFGAGQYRPQSTAGTKLLTHELVHVVQQENTTLNQPSTSIEPLDSGGHRVHVLPPLSERGDIYEQQADHAASSILQKDSIENTGFLRLNSAAIQPVTLPRPLPICGAMVTDIDVLPARPRPLTECGLPPTLMVTRVNVVGRARTPASTGGGRIIFNLHIGYYRDPATNRLCGVISDSKRCLTPGCIHIPCFPTLREILEKIWDIVKTILKAVGYIFLIIIGIVIFRGLRIAQETSP